jgi:glycosyltransferase involved in cell wall biosynthesis
MSRPALSLVIPAYNEERRLPRSLTDIQAFFGKFTGGDGAGSIEILTVVEKSRDRTLELAHAAVRGDSRFQIIDNVVHRGKGFAVRSGMLRAQGEIVFFMDADLSTPLSEVLRFLAHFQENPDVDVIIGSRRDPNSEILKRQNLFRQQLGRGFNYFVKLFGVRGIKDTQCGFKAFRAQACRDIFSRATIDGFAFDVEALMLAQEMGYRIDVRPVIWVNSPDSKVRVLIDPLKMLWDLLRIRYRVRRALRLNPRA